jgi:hypothetical protein
MKLAMVFQTPVKRLMREMDSEEYAWWLAYDRIEPIGALRSDLMLAQVCSILANVNRDSKKKPTPYELSDFLFEFDKTKEQKEEEQRAAVEKKFLAVCAAIKRKQERKNGNR